MAPRKNNTKATKAKKPPTREQPRSPSTLAEESNRSSRAREYRSLKTADELRDVMGAESDSSISNIENDSYRSNTIQSRPNFSFLPSHQHSSPNKNHSPKRTNAAAPHRLASMPTVPNTDHEENDSTSAASTPRKSSRKPSPTKSKTKNRQQAQSSNDRQAHTRKQRAPGQLKVLKEIINLQGTVHNLIPKLSFSRVIREVLSEYSTRSLRVTPQMLLCLQEATEIYLVQLFEDSYRCTLHRDRVTLIPKDMQLAYMLRRTNT